MKNTLLLFFFVLILSALSAQQHTIPDLKTYNRLKAEGLLNPKANYSIAEELLKQEKPLKQGVIKRAAQRSVPCGFVETTNFQDPWGGDVYFDDSPPFGPFEVQLPFTFCFYDQQYTSFFINNNGNITFDAQYTTFTSSGFPSATVPPMIAPFWADVYTTGGLGQVRFEVYPDYAIVSWDSVGVYPGIDLNQRNTFQLIITDGVSPVLPPQTNISFIYGDMQWTTGTASQGTGGFGGTPATVGVNRGDGIDYIQLGRFDAPGNDYDGPFGNNDQVDFLDNSIFFFNTCLASGSNNNIAPLSLGAPICDTLIVCTGGTIPLNFFFIPVEPGQIVNAQLLTTDLSGLVLDTIISGAQCEVVATFTGSAVNQGFNTISFLATDNGTPAASYQLDITVQVLPSNFTPIITGTPAICSGESTTLSVEGGPYEQYLWAPILDQSPTAEISENSIVSVTVSGNGQCGVSEPFEVTVRENPIPIIMGQNSVCNDATTVLYTEEQYAEYSWSTSSSNDSITVGIGQYVVSVIDEHGCQGISPLFEVISGLTFVPEITGPNLVCPGNSIAITSTEPYAFYYWSNGSSDSINFITNPGTYNLFAINYEGCSGTSEPFVVNGDSSETILPPIIDGGGLLFTAFIGQITWFYNGIAVAENVNFIQDIQPGLYYYSIITDSGCEFISDSLYIEVTSARGNFNSSQIIVNTITDSYWSFSNNLPYTSYILYSSDGRCVAKGNAQGILDSSSLSAGVYFLRVNDFSQTYTLKLIKQ